MTRTFRRFRLDDRGAVALWLGVMVIPLLMLVGSGVDFGRGLYLRRQLQAAADAAALAGAAAYVSDAAQNAAKTTATTYMQDAVSRIASGQNITFAVTTSSTASGGATTAYKVTVTASGTSSNALTKMMMAGMTASANAVAANYVYNVSIDVTDFNSDAWDANTIYYYIVPTDGSIPAASALTRLAGNTGGSWAKTVNFSLTASQKLGFALKNITGGVRSYGNNAYGGYPGSQHDFYSHLSVAAQKAYPSMVKNCYLQVAGSIGQIVSNTCLASMPALSTLNCASAAGKTLVYAWNDMGGGSDDLDYNDAVLTVKCAAVDKGSTATGVILTN